MVFGGLQGEVCVCYVDDCVVMSSSIEAHFRRLDLVAERIRAAQHRMCQRFHQPLIDRAKVDSRKSRTRGFQMKTLIDC